MGHGAGSIPFRFYRMLVILGTSLFGACGLTSMFFGGYVLYRMDSFLTMLSISASMAMVVGGGFSLVVLIPVGCCTAVRGKLGTLIMFNAVLCISVVVGVVAVAFLNMHMSKLVDVGVMKVGLYQGRGSIGFAEIALNRMENFVNCSFNNCCQPGKPVVARIWGTELPLQHVTMCVSACTPSLPSCSARIVLRPLLPVLPLRFSPPSPPFSPRSPPSLRALRPLHPLRLLFCSRDRPFAPRLSALGIALSAHLPLFEPPPTSCLQPSAPPPPPPPPISSSHALPASLAPLSPHTWTRIDTATTASYATRI